jgi:hypothetical protein
MRPSPRGLRRAQAAKGRLRAKARLTLAVGLTETGQRGELGPYDMNVDGRAVHSDTLAQAMVRLAAARAQGAKLIDVG